MWVGIGGFKPTSDALEQIGTEVDCNPAGNTVSSAWYELVPAPSKTISLAVHPGDVMHATVTVMGHHVTVVLRNLTSHKTFRKSLNAPSIDVSSAEWIVEAPSECISQFACQALPLANFGSVGFDSATVTSTNGIAGSIISPRWWRTKIELTPGSQRFIVARQTSDTAGSATPSPLSGAGSDVRRDVLLGRRSVRSSSTERGRAGCAPPTSSTDASRRSGRPRADPVGQERRRWCVSTNSIATVALGDSPQPTDAAPPISKRARRRPTEEIEPPELATPGARRPASLSP